MRGRWRPLRDRRLVAGAVVVAIALVVTIAVAPWPSGPSHPPRAETVADANCAAAGCADVLVVGLDGNGQQPRAGPHLRVHRRHRRTPRWWRARRATVAPSRSPASRSPRSPRPRSSQHQRRPDQSTLSAISKPGLRAWRQPVFDGVRATLALVTDRIARCPERPVLLVGFAQGASVVHRVLGRVAAERWAVPPGRRHRDRRPRPAGPLGRAAGAG